MPPIRFLLPGLPVIVRSIVQASLLVSGCAQGQGTAEIVVGQLLSHEGALVEAAQELKQGAQACADAVGAAGGINGRRLRIVVADDSGEPGRAVERARELLAREGLVALLTPMGRRANAALLPWAAEQGLAVVAPYGAGAMSVRASAWPSTFFLRTASNLEALRLAQQLQTLGVERVGIVYADDELGRETLALFEEALASVGLAQAVSLALRVGEAGSVAAELRRRSVQALLMATVGEQTGSMLRALAQGQAMPMIVPYGLSTAATPALLASAAAQGLVLAQGLPPPHSSEEPVARAYRDALRSRPGVAPSYIGFEACVAVLTLARALRGQPEAHTRAGLLQALRRSALVDLGGWSVDLSDRQRPGSRYTDIVRVGPSGRWVR